MSAAWVSSLSTSLPRSLLTRAQEELADRELYNKRSHSTAAMLPDADEARWPERPDIGHSRWQNSYVFSPVSNITHVTAKEPVYQESYFLLLHVEGNHSPSPCPRGFRNCAPASLFGLAKMPPCSSPKCPNPFSLFITTGGRLTLYFHFRRGRVAYTSISRDFFLLEVGASA